MHSWLGRKMWTLRLYTRDLSDSNIASVVRHFVSFYLMSPVISLVPKTWVLVTSVSLRFQTRSMSCTVSSTALFRISTIKKHCVAAALGHCAAFAGFNCNSYFSFTSTQGVIYQPSLSLWAARCPKDRRRRLTNIQTHLPLGPFLSPLDLPNLRN